MVRTNIKITEEKNNDKKKRHMSSEICDRCNKTNCDLWCQTIDPSDEFKICDDCLKLREGGCHVKLKTWQPGLS